MTNTPTPAARLLVIDDEPDLRTLYELTLQRAGYQVQTAADVQQALDLLQQNRYDAIITDMRLPDGLGLELVQWLQTQQRPERSIVITAYGSADNAVRALKAGAFDYLNKPINLDQFRQVVAQAVAASNTPAQPNTAEQASPITSTSTSTPAPAPAPAPASTPTPTANTPAPSSAAPSAASNTISAQQNSALAEMVGSGSLMQQLKATLLKVAPSMAPVLILGESGSGKELVARALHRCSHRHQGPFIAVNCGAIPETLLEAEFFGAKKGAYTGSVADREGFFQAACGGTLFLDEIGDLPLSMQAKLLRVIQERQVRQLGAAQETAIDVRIVSATHKNLTDMVQAGSFRQDLYYRLNVIDVRVPPLRERRQDIPELAKALLRKITADSGQPPPTMQPEFLQHLQNLPLAGNVRELENTLHRCWALSDGKELSANLLHDIPQQPAPAPASAPLSAPPPASIATTTATASPAETTPASSAPAATISSERPLLAEEVAFPCQLDHFINAHEKALLLRALHQVQFNRTAAAALLGLNLRQIRYRMERLGIISNDKTDDNQPT